MREVRLRTLERVNSEALMVASGQNVKRLLEFGHRGPRKTAQAAALRPPDGPRRREVRRRPRSTRPYFNRLGEIMPPPNLTLECAAMLLSTKVRLALLQITGFGVVIAAIVTVFVLLLLDGVVRLVNEYERGVISFGRL